MKLLRLVTFLIVSIACTILMLIFIVIIIYLLTLIFGDLIY